MQFYYLKIAKIASLRIKAKELHLKVAYKRKLCLLVLIVQCYVNSCYK